MSTKTENNQSTRRSFMKSNFSCIIDNSEVVAFFKELKAEEFHPSSVSITNHKSGFSTLIVFNDEPDFYISDKKLRLANSTADESEFILDFEGKSIEAIWEETSDETSVSVTLSVLSTSSCAAIDFFK